MYTPINNEQLFEVKPVGVKYICEFCNEGEMIHSYKDHYSPEEYDCRMIPHTCDKCGKVMKLPKIYPYIEWNKD